MISVFRRYYHEQYLCDSNGKIICPSWLTLFWPRTLQLRQPKSALSEKLGALISQKTANVAALDDRNADDQGSLLKAGDKMEDRLRHLINDGRTNKQTSKTQSVLA